MRTPSRSNDTAYCRQWMLGEEPLPLEVLTEFAERMLLPPCRGTG